MTAPETPDAKLVREAAEELRFGDYEGNLPDRLEALAERLSAPPLIRWEKAEDCEDTNLLVGNHVLAWIEADWHQDGGYIGHDSMGAADWRGTEAECRDAILKYFGLSASSVAGCAGETK